MKRFIGVLVILLTIFAPFAATWARPKVKWTLLGQAVDFREIETLLALAIKRVASGPLCLKWMELRSRCATWS
jgi:hypothetical protein